MNTIVIASVNPLQVLDSRGYPTVQVRLDINGSGDAVASAPSGASTGKHEAVELRDGGKAYGGRGVTRAIAALNGPIADLVKSREWESLEELDQALIDLDGTPNKSRLGANSIVAVSMAAARAFARADNQPLHVWMAQLLGTELRVPVPHFNVLNGGAHAANRLEFQEFMIAPVGAPNIATAVEWGSEIYHALASELRRRGLGTGLGDEGGFAPDIARPEEALDLLMAAIASTGLGAGRDRDVAIAIDPAANGFYADGRYTVAGSTYSSDELVDYFGSLLDAYPIWSIEDGLAEDDTAGWAMLNRALAGRAQIVGDDLLVTSPARIRAAADANMVTAALIKPNQIGTVTETFAALTAARECGLGAMISHRSGETVDTFVADLAVASGVGQLKSGAPARGERVAKYNRLVEIGHAIPELPYGIPDMPRIVAAP